MSSGNSPCPTGIRLVGFDVDGVDGFGIRSLLDAGIAVAVISGRRSGAVERRMAELGVRHVVQGCKDKVAAFGKIAAELGIGRNATAFVGDDVPDLPLLGSVGWSVAVANAVAEVRAACDAVTTAPGGGGAVREVCDLILAAAARNAP